MTTETLIAGQATSEGSAAPAAAAPAVPPVPAKAAEGAPAPATTAESKSEAKPADAVPESYVWKQPAEGAAFDPEVLKVYGEVAKELKLSQVNAQKVIDRLAPVMAQRQAQQIETVIEGWAEEVKADPEIGGDKLTENLGFANKAIAAFGDDALFALLRLPSEGGAGLGNNLAFIRAMAKAGRAISGDSRFVAGSETTGAPGDDKATLARRYPSTQGQ